MTQMPRVTSGWLALRETADAAARSAELVELARRNLGGAPSIVVHDLGCGTGSMGRWLAPQLPGPQTWVMHDRDSDLLELAAVGLVDRAGDGLPVTGEARLGDIADLSAADLAGASLVTASALLDLLTEAEVGRIAAACAGAGAPALLTISVVGRVDLTPADPLDDVIASAFNAHQRRAVGDRELLGPDAVAVAVAAFEAWGMVTTVRPSPWRLRSDDAYLIADWLSDWLGAACLQRPELAAPAEGYERRRLDELARGALQVVVHHDDLFAHRE